MIGAAKQANSEGVALLDTEDLASDMRSRGVEAHAAQSNEDALRVLRERCQSDSANNSSYSLPTGHLAVSLTDLLMKDSSKL